MITKPILETNLDKEGSVIGSWAPTLILFFILFIRWIAFGQDNLAIRLRRFCNIQVSFYSHYLLQFINIRISNIMISKSENQSDFNLYFPLDEFAHYLFLTKFNLFNV